MTTLFLCNPEAALHAQLAADHDHAWLEYQQSEDINHEKQLAHEAVEDDEIDSWPWYADAPIEIVDPEIIEDAELAGLPVSAAGEEDELDEIPVDVAEDDCLD